MHALKIVNMEMMVDVGVGKGNGEGWGGGGVAGGKPPGHEADIMC